MSGLVIDERGKTSVQMARMPGGGSHAKNFDAAPDEFLQRGAIYLYPLPCTLIVVFSPHLVARRTLTAAFFEIARRYPARVDLLCFGTSGSWRETLAPTGNVFERIDQIVGEAARSYPRGLIAARLRPEVIDLVAGGRLAPAYAMWMEARGAWTTGLYEGFRRQRLLDHAVIVRNPRGSSRLIIEHWGRKRDLYGAQWICRARGKALQEQPYPGLTTWVEAGIREAMATREPRLEAVRIQLLDPAGRSRRRRYERLLLPWIGADGDAFTTSFTIDHKRS